MRDGLARDPDFIERNRADLAASIQRAIIETLLHKLGLAADAHPEVRQVAIGGGVSANSGVRQAIGEFCDRRGLRAWIPPRQFTTDNAAMVAIAGYFKWQKREVCPLDAPPFSRVTV